MRDSTLSLLNALRLALMLRPRARLAPGGAFWLLAAAGLSLAVGLVLDAVLVPQPREFDPPALASRAFPFLLALALGAWLAASQGRRAIWLRVAATWLLATLPVGLLLHALRSEDPNAALPLHGWERGLLALYLFALVWQLLRWIDRNARWSRRLLAALPACAAAWAALVWLPTYPWWWSWEEETWEEPVYSFSPEALLYAQPERVAAALERVLPQRPGTVDLYLLGFAGDGSERVFRNEVEYVDRLFAQRFGTAGRSLLLANSSAAPERHPLASLTNLRQALRGLAQRMDPQEDILLLFLTSHGSETHELLVGLDPLPLDQVRPDALRALLDEAGIRHRVLIVSACYAGGFIPALEGPDTLLMTAAREDRSSFGCGADSEITWFGEALFADALNRETDLQAAFALAGATIAQWEKDADFEASHPQLRVGEGIEARLARWREGLVPGPPLDFRPHASPPDAAPESD